MVFIDSNKPAGRWDGAAHALEIASKAVSLLAVLVGGWWAYTQFTVERHYAQNVQVAITPELVSKRSQTPALVVNATLKNIGRIPIWAGQKGDSEYGEGCELTVIENADYSAVALKSPRIIDWDVGGGSIDYVVNKHNLLAGYLSYRNKNYVINPGQEEHEVGVVPVKKGKLYGIRVRFFSSEGRTSADFRYVYVPTDEEDRAAGPGGSVAACAPRQPEDA